MFVYKNGGQEQCDNKTLQNAGMKETNDKNEEKISDNNKPSNMKYQIKKNQILKIYFLKILKLMGQILKKKKKL